MSHIWLVSDFFTCILSQKYFTLHLKKQITQTTLGVMLGIHEYNNVTHEHLCFIKSLFYIVIIDI